MRSSNSAQTSLPSPVRSSLHGAAVYGLFHRTERGCRGPSARIIRCRCGSLPAPLSIKPQEQEGHAEGDHLTIPTAASAQQRVTEYDFQTVAASYSLRFKRDVDAVNHADGD